jgi:hypothetical protein
VEEVFDGIHGRVTYVFDGIIQGAVKVLFKRKDAVHSVYVAADGADTIPFPCPKFGGNVVTDRDVEVLFYEGGDLEVEAGVINEYEDVGLVDEDIFLGSPERGEDGREMQKDGDEAHVSSVAIMPKTISFLGTHEISSHETEAGLGIGAP